MLTLVTSRLGTLWSIFEPLVNREGKPVLATSWENPSDTTWVFHLRQATFHNGDRFDAGVVKANIERWLDPANKAPLRAQVAPISAVDAVDASTVKITTSAPYSTLLDGLGDVLMVAPSTFATAAKQPVGTGPFRFVSWAVSQDLVLEAYPQHWAGSPKLARQVWRTLPEPAARLTSLKSGEVDIVNSVPYPEVARFSAPNVQVVRRPGIQAYAIYLNSGKPPFNDVRVRQALNYAINKEQLARSIMFGLARPAQGPLSQDYPGFNAAVQPYPYDPDKAKSLLNEAGVATPLRVSFIGTAGRTPQDKELAQAVAGQLGEVGFDVDFQVLEYTTWLKTYKEGEGFMVESVVFPTQKFMETNYSSKIKSFAWNGYTNPEVDDLITRAGQTLDQKARDAIYSTLHQKIRDDAAWGFLLNLDAVFGVANRVQGFQPRGDDVFDVTSVSVA
jgi:peptide/nickel transport system substrate-binding protein